MVLRSVIVVVSAALLVSFVAGCGAPAAVQTAPPVDTLESHARAQDDEGLRRARTAMHSKSRDDRVQGLAAVLEYEPSRLATLVDVLVDRLAHGEDAQEKAAAAWALVRAGNGSVASDVLGAYASGGLQHVKRLDGTAGFDAVALARYVASATVPPEQTALKNRIVGAALGAADPKTRALLVHVLVEDTDEGAALLSAAESLDPQKDFATLEHVFQRLAGLADARASDALARYADHATHPHFRTLAALRLAELGDMRAAAHLAWRLGEDPQKLYDASDPATFPLTRDDQERVRCARMLDELALVHPEARTQLREMVDSAALAWMRSHGVPHQNGLALLVDVGSQDVLPVLKKLADPQTPVPTIGATPPIPEDFIVAESALRFLGRTHDAAAWGILMKQLGRRPATFDASLEARMQEKVVVPAVVYEALELGAVNGLWELGDAKAVASLVKLAEDPKASERGRAQACSAAAWLADVAARRGIVAKVGAPAPEHGPARPKAEMQRMCWLVGLAERPNAAVDAPLVALLSPKATPETRHATARLLGAGGLAAPERGKLEALLKDKALVHDAALALLLGGDAASVKRALEAYEPPQAEDAPPPPPLEPLKQLYVQSMPKLSEELLASGTLARMASLAIAARDVVVRGVKQTWVLQALAYQLRQMGDVDAGPRSMTHVRMRARLVADAKGTDVRKRDDALLLLWVLGERAALASLGDVAKERLGEPSP